MIRSIIQFFIFIWCSSFLNLQTAQALDVQKIKTKQGIEAWLVQDSSLPLISLQFAFIGGAVQDAVGKEGLTNFMTSLLDEGAGNLNAQAFQKQLQSKAIELSFAAQSEHIEGSLRTLNINRAEAGALLKSVLLQPRFDEDAIERVRQQILASLRRERTHPPRLALNAFFGAAFPGHPYGRRNAGTEETISTFKKNDFVQTHQNQFALNRLKIAVVGDISPQDLSQFLDDVFGALPQQKELQPIAPVSLQGASRRIVIDQQGAQSLFYFGGKGMLRDDPDYISGIVLQHIFAGDAMLSRLGSELREKRGLTYGASASLSSFDHAGLWLGSFSTKNASAAEALQIVESEITKLKKEGVTDAELANAKSYLIGNYPLNFDTSAKVASLLLNLQLDHLPSSYISDRENLIKAVTKEDLKRVIDRLFAEPLLTVIVGQPKGVEAR